MIPMPPMDRNMGPIDTQFGTYDRDDAAHVGFAFGRSRDELAALLDQTRARRMILAQHLPTMADLLDDVIESLAGALALCDDVLAAFDAAQAEPAVPGDRDAA